LSHTKVNGRFAIRFHAAQTYIQKAEIDHAINTLNCLYRSVSFY
jgi:hypothetical protein